MAHRVNHVANVSRTILRWSRSNPSWNEARYVGTLSTTNSRATTTSSSSSSSLRESVPLSSSFSSSRRRFTASAESEEDTKKSGEDEPPVWRNPNVPEWDRRVMIDEFEPGEKIPFAELPDITTEEGKVLATKELHDLAERVIDLKLRDVVLLSKMLQRKMGLTDDDLRTGVPGGGGGGGAAAEAEPEAVEEEKTAFNLKLTGFDAKSKIKVIKEVRSMTGLGLKEAKEMVEGAPKVLKTDIKKEEAEELKAKLEAVGGTVEIE